MIETNTGTTAASAAPVYNDFGGLARLRHAAREQSPETVREVAQQFEALFIQMMLKNMRNGAVEGALFGSDQEKLYRDMFDQQLSVDLSEKGALGLADLLVRQLSRLPGPGGDAAPSVSAPAAQPPAPQARPAAETSAAAEEIRTPEDFIRLLAPHAEAAARELGVPPQALLAQAALETGWGKNVARRADGASSHNLFGIKADARWPGQRLVAETLEYEDGVAVKRRESFRAYDSYADSFADYAAFLRESPRYGAALEAGADAAAFLHGLQQAGYATDPEYASKIHRIAYGEDSRLADWPFSDAGSL